MQELVNLLSIISIVLTIGGIFGGILAFRNGFSRTANEVQERVINAMQQEVAILHLRLSDLEKENQRLEQIISTICAALKKRGFVVTIEGNLVTISDNHETQSARIQS